MKSLYLNAVFLLVLTFPLVAQQMDIDQDSLPPLVEIPEPEPIPEVNFNYSDPCDPANQKEDGMPWQDTRDSMEVISQEYDVPLPPPIEDFETLSSFHYNAAVSMAFEGMKLVYGVMPETEYKKFEALWLPLFDYPNEDIVDYLNKLNPIIANFLALRNAYMEKLIAIEMLTLDMAEAVAADDREAWDMIMSEGVFHSRDLKFLQKSLEALADQLTRLGNPPNPLLAKCEAAKRYRRMLPKIDHGPIGECWSGYRISPVQAGGMATLYQPVFRHVVQVNGTYQIIELKETAIVTGLKSEYDWLNYIEVEQVREDYDPQEGMTGDPAPFKKVRYPHIPEFKETGYMNYLFLSQQSDAGEEHENYEELIRYSNACKTYLSRKQTAGYFFKRAMLWSYKNRWAYYELDENGLLPDEALEDFVDDMREEMRAYLEAEELKRKERKKRKRELEEENRLDTTRGIAYDMSAKDSVELARIQKQENIDSRKEVVESIKDQIQREREYMSREYASLAGAKGSERQAILQRINDIKRRIMGFQSTMQSELDVIRGMETGVYSRTRQVFDDYAKQKFLKDTKLAAQRRQSTSRIAEGMFRQIKLLPYTMQEKARDYMLKALDPEAIARGDLETALKTRNTINEMVAGYALQEGAAADEVVANQNLNEDLAKAVIAGAGAVTMGISGAHLIAKYGAGSTAAVYGTKMVGVIWGGVTGYLSGGPKEALRQSVSYFSPYTASGVAFYDGYEMAGKRKGATTRDKIWAGVQKAGIELVAEKIFEKSVEGITQGILYKWGPECRVFKPIFSTSTQSGKNALRVLREAKGRQNAKDVIGSFNKLNQKLFKLNTDPDFNGQSINDLKAELKQLTASMNADYHVKWHMKYKAKPSVRNNFDKYVQSNYDDMIPKMTEKLQSQGYVMDGIEFKQFRNADAGGTSSMDLDLAPVIKGTTKEPKIFANFKYVTLGGKRVKVKTAELNEIDIADFMIDAQGTMNSTYKDQFGISAPMSDMNLVTSVHPEAYATTKLLEKEVDWSTITPEEFASVGKVYDVKMETIKGNKVMTNIAKKQAMARETHKELKNMLLPKLRSDLRGVKKGSPKYKKTLEKLDYWTKMNDHFKKIGTQETNPLEILNQERIIEMETGGKRVNEVRDDLMMCFGFDPLKARQAQLVK